MKVPHEDIKVFPTLTFWYGMSYQELMRMPNWALWLYAEALPGLLSEYQSMHLLAASYPYMRKEDQRNIQRRLRSDAAKRSQTKRPRMSQAMYRSRMLAMGVTWREPDRKSN
jgi:hypothetical protein